MKIANAYAAIKKIGILPIATFLIVLITSCSTAAVFKLPRDTYIIFHNKVAKMERVRGGAHKVTTRAFFWTAWSGIPFEVENFDGKVVKTGKLSSGIRISPFFAMPPWGLIAYPLGFGDDIYDLTGDEVKVILDDDQ